MKYVCLSLASRSVGLFGRTVCLLALILGSGGSNAQSAENLSGLSDKDLAEGWISLFDGTSLYGWKAASKTDWKVNNGAIEANSGEVGLLHTTTQFSDYELRLEFQAATDTNSGVFLRTSPRPKSAKSDCYELNIAPISNPYPTGSLAGRKKVSGKRKFNPAAWHEFEVRLEAGRIVAKINGQVVMEYDDPKPLGRGFIGLQFREGPIAFRSIRLRPLRLDSLFNGRDLAGWNTDLKRKSLFSVSESGELKVVNGPGQLESERQFADLVMQLECKCNGKELNSGVFFRSIPGDFSNGYESQIHNGMKEGDPTKPNNGGTGGIFRRQEARRIVAEDHAWFFMTIVADGPHMACWVNGYQVTDWTDRREPDENPRKGLRREAGTLILQGHDPTTDLLFRNLRAGEMASRR